jgi:hypothetical protein
LKAGFDATSTPSENRRRASDDSQLEWAASAGRTLITFNVGHFVRLHSEWIQQGRHHAGVVVSRQRSVSDTIGRLLRLATSLDDQAMHDRLEFLSDW